MNPLFNPKSVVVIGVSERQDNMARTIVENLLEFQFQGEIFLVGKSEGTFHGIKIHPSMNDLREAIDVAVVLTPAPTVPGVLESCGRKKIRWAILETGGFSEYSQEGARLEQDVLAVARKWGIRIVGPNGIGIINPENGFVVPFIAMEKVPMHKGKVSILAQSGGVSFAYYNLLSNANVGAAKIVSMGNKADLNEIDFLRYLMEDPQTEIIGLYLESIERGKELMALGRASAKPMIVHKANIGEGSMQIAKLHTAALANDDRIVEAALKQANIVRAADFRCFVNAVKAFSLPPMRGRQLVIVSRSGGLALISADSAEKHGFRLHPFTREFQERIHSYFRAKVIRPTNPLDLGDLFDFDLYIKILDEVLRIETVNGVLFQHGAVGEEKEPSHRLIKTISDLSLLYKKPVALCYLTDEEERAHAKRMIDFPIFDEPFDALQGLAISRDHWLGREVPGKRPVSYRADRNRAKEALRKAMEEKRDPLLPEALALLRVYGFQVAEGQVIQEKKALKKAVKEIGSPVAMKVISPKISHKSDRGGVALNITGASAAENAFEALRKLGGKDCPGVLMQEMVSGGVEIILGAKRDPAFGPVVLVGPGGIYVEILKENAIRVAPISRYEAEEMISELKASAILRGARGKKALDVKALVDALLRLSQLMIDFPEIEGIDINPVIVREKGAVVVDARISLKQ